MKKLLTIATLCAIGFASVGCANLQGGVQSLVSPAAQKVAEISSALSPDEAAAARAAYYAETDRVLVGWSPGDEGYAAAVKKYITEPAEFQSGFLRAAITGDYDFLIRKLAERGGVSEGITKDGDCFVLRSGWRSCPPPLPPPTDE